MQCQAVSEEEIHAILSEQSLYPAGWIHVTLATIIYPFVLISLELSYYQIQLKMEPMHDLLDMFIYNGCFS